MRGSPIVNANAIRLKRQVYSGCFLVVEGRDDKLLLKQFVDRAICSVTVVDGKQNVADVVGILEAERFPGVVGIVDADFDHVEGYQWTSDNIIVLGAVDLEALLIRSSALDRVLVELGSARKTAEFGRDVREVLVAAAVWIGCLRLHSLRAGLTLTFQGLKYAQCVDRTSLAIDTDALVREVMNRSQRRDLLHQDIVREISSIRRSLDDHWLVCYGTDMVEILAIALRKALGTNSAKAVEPAVVRRCLRLAFQRDDLDRSGLGRDLQAWAARNSGFHVLRPAQPD